MKIQRVEYAGTVATPDGPRPGTLPQVAFSGRSNVGKSSLINALLLRTRSKLAHVSATPGKTQALNFYRVNDRFFLVDLPGFGFARVPAPVREGWRRLIEGYLARETALKGVVHLVDARRGVLESDLKMIEYLATLGIPVLVVLTKIDKLKRAEQRKAMDSALETLELEPEQILPFSSKTSEGREELLAALEVLLSVPDQPDTSTPGSEEEEEEEEREAGDGDDEDEGQR